MEFTTWFNGQRIQIVTDSDYVVTGAFVGNVPLILSPDELDTLQGRVNATMADCALYNSETER